MDELVFFPSTLLPPFDSMTMMSVFVFYGVVCVLSLLSLLENFWAYPLSHDNEQCLRLV